MSSLLHPIPDLSSRSPKEVGMSTHMEERSATWMLRCSYFIQMKVKGEKVQDIPYDEVRPLRVSSGAQCGLHTVYSCMSTWDNLIGQN